MPVLWKALVSSSVGNTEASFLETTRKQIDRFMGTIVHCPSCDTALIRVAHARGDYLLDYARRARS